MTSKATANANEQVGALKGEQKTQMLSCVQNIGKGFAKLAAADVCGGTALVMAEEILVAASTTAGTIGTVGTMATAGAACASGLGILLFCYLAYEGVKHIGTAVGTLSLKRSVTSTEISL